MQQTLEVVYEGGVFRPVTPPDPSIEEGQRLRVSVEPAEREEEQENVLELMFHFYADVSDAERGEIEKIVLDRRDFFSDKAEA